MLTTSLYVHRQLVNFTTDMLIEVMRMRIMNNEKKIQDAEKEAGGDEKLIFKFAWPNLRQISLWKLTQPFQCCKDYANSCTRAATVISQKISF